MDHGLYIFQDHVVGFADKMISKFTNDNEESLNHRFSVIAFSNNYQIVFKLVSPKEAKAQLHNTIFSGGLTNIADPLQAARTEIFNQPEDRPDAPNVIILLTDGIPTIHAERTLPEAILAHLQGITVIVIGVAQATEEDAIGVLTKLASDEDKFYPSEQFENLLG